jgi:hypothetical protein
MARISTVMKGGKYRVSIRGALSARDLARLERACGPALEHEQIPLEIRAEQMTTVDEASRLFLGQLATRGAVILTL